MLDERKLALKILSEGFSKNKWKEIGVLVKYFASEGLSIKDAEARLLEFLSLHDPDYNDVTDYKNIHKQVNRNYKQKIRTFDSVSVTHAELEFIRSLKNYRYEKVLFVLLVLAKFYHGNKGGSKYYVKIKQTSCFNLAHVTQKKGELIFAKLHDAGALTYNVLYDNYYLTFTDSEDNSGEAIKVTDIESIVSFYPPYCNFCGEPLDKAYNTNTVHPECFHSSRKETFKRANKNRKTTK